MKLIDELAIEADKSEAWCCQCHCDFMEGFKAGFRKAIALSAAEVEHKVKVYTDIGNEYPIGTPDHEQFYFAAHCIKTSVPAILVLTELDAKDRGNSP